jgi:hypothetical protein
MATILKFRRQRRRRKQPTQQDWYYTSVLARSGISVGELRELYAEAMTQVHASRARGENIVKLRK